MGGAQAISSWSKWSRVRDWLRGHVTIWHLRNARELLGIPERRHLIQPCPDWGRLPGEADGWAESGVLARAWVTEGCQAKGSNRAEHEVDAVQEAESQGFLGAGVSLVSGRSCADKLG